MVIQLKNEIQIDFSKIEKDYILHDDPMYSDPEIIKIINKLPKKEKTLLILYAELNSCRKIAEIYNCSQSIIYLEIKRIRNKIKEMYDS